MAEKQKQLKIPILQPLVRKSLESGLITPLAVGENRMPETACTEAINWDFQTIGPAKTRAGITKMGSTLPGPILGIHQFIDTVGLAKDPSLYSATFVKASSQYMHVADTVPLSITSTLTMEAWIKLSSQPGNGVDYCVMSKWEATGNQRSYLFAYQFYQGNYQIEISISNDGSFDSANTVNVTIPTGAWTHIAVVVDTTATSGYVYINGVLQGTFTPPGSIFNSTAGFEVGSRDGTSGPAVDYFDGQIDDVRVWNTVRTAAQIQANYLKKLTGSESGLVGYWTLSNTLADSTANAATLTNYGATFTADTPFLPSIPVNNTQQIVVSGTNAYYLSGSSYSSIRSGLTSGAKARFADFLNSTFMVNGKDATATWNGDITGSFSTSGNAQGAPIGKFVETFSGRVWIAGNPSYPDNLYYSTVPTLATQQSISWSTDPNTGTQYFPVSPNDGECITALKRYKNVLVVFKQNRMYKVYSPASSDSDPCYVVGTYSHESVIETKEGLFFHHSSGFYQYNVYGIVQQISIPINDIVFAIPASAFASVAGWVEPDGDHINWSIGTVTYGGVTYQNMVLRYRISTQVWTHRSYPVQFLCSGRYTDGTTLRTVVGASNGNTYLYNVGTTDDGIPISYSLVHRWENIDGLISTRKNIMTVGFNHYGGAGTNVSYQIQGDPVNDWTKRVGKGQFDQYNTGFNSVNIKGKKIRIGISGQNIGQPIEYHGYEMIGATDELITFTQQ